MNKVELAKMMGLNCGGHVRIVTDSDIFELKEYDWNYIDKWFSNSISVSLDRQDINKYLNLDIMKDEVTPEQLSQLIWELAADKYFEKLNSVIDKFN